MWSIEGFLSLFLMEEIKQCLNDNENYYKKGNFDVEERKRRTLQEAISMGGILKCGGI